MNEAATLATGERKAGTGARPGVWVVYRTGAGVTHLDWPTERIGEALADTEGTLWVDILEGAENLSKVSELFRDVFQFHPLSIDDALQESHVPKVDDWNKYLYTVFYAIEFDAESLDLTTNELDVFLGTNYLVTFRGAPMGFIDRLRTFFERDAGDRLVRGPDHALYLLFDMACNEYLTAIDHLDHAIDEAQDEVFARPTPKTLQRIFRVKQATMRLHRILAPQREVFNRLARDPYKQIDEKDRVYFRDVYDHMVRMYELNDTVRDLIAGALDTYLSAVANRTNDVMKTLTIVSAMFLPLNFVAGFFGMNFFGANIELDEFDLPHRAIFLGTMVLMMFGPWTLWWFGRKRRWF